MGAQRRSAPRSRTKNRTRIVCPHCSKPLTVRLQVVPGRRAKART